MKEAKGNVTVGKTTRRHIMPSGPAPKTPAGSLGIRAGDLIYRRGSNSF